RNNSRRKRDRLESSCTYMPFFFRRPTRPQAPIPIDFTDGQHHGYSRARPLQRAGGRVSQQPPMNSTLLYLRTKLCFVSPLQRRTTPHAGAAPDPHRNERQLVNLPIGGKT
ncbi:unnamed protein product, partial [Ectocarpus sp. 12 AP-2014]